jgi:hypothetical protein
MGFNPFRRHRRSPVDIALVVGTFLIAAVLVIWALTG